MTEVCIRGAAYDGRGACALTIGKEGKSREFDVVLPTRNGNIPLMGVRGGYQCELYALSWAVSLMSDPDYPLVVRTSSLAVGAWIKDRECPDEYMDLFSVFLGKTEGKSVSVIRTDLGSRKMCGVRDMILSYELWNYNKRD